MLLALGGFVVAATLIILLPGPDTLVVVRGLVRGGLRRGVVTAAGVLSGLTVWVSAAVLGISALLAASRVGYDVLRVVGAGYMMWLGVQSLRSCRASDASAAEPARRSLLGSGFVAGLLTDVLNPKVGVFFVTFLPGFLPHGSPVAAASLLFGATYVVLTVLYFVVLLVLARRVTSVPHIRRRLDAITGTILVALDLRLALEP